MQRLIWFWLTLPEWLLMLSICSCACGSFLHLLWRNVYSDNFLFINLLLLNCESSSCILDTSPLSDMWFTNIFSTLWSFHFAAQIFLILMIANLIFLFVTVFGKSKKLLPHPRSGRFTPVFSSKRASLVAQRLKHLPAMRETWVWSLGQEDPQEKEMATHSSILAWRIPWTEEPGGL